MIGQGAKDELFARSCFDGDENCMMASGARAGVTSNDIRIVSVCAVPARSRSRSRRRVGRHREKAEQLNKLVEFVRASSSSAGVEQVTERGNKR